MSSSKGRTKAALNATAAITALAAVVFASTACSSTKLPAAVLTPAPIPSDPSTSDPGASQPSTGAPGPTFGGAPFPDAALSGWMVDLVKGDFPGACKYMGQKGKAGTPPTAPTQALCSELASNKAGKDLLTGMQKTFTPSGAGKTSVAVVVTDLTPTGTTATATDTQVKLNGKLLRDVIIANSKGIPAGKSTATFQLTEIGKLWYVTDFGLNG